MEAAVIQICQELAESARINRNNKSALKANIFEACQQLHQLIKDDVETPEAETVASALLANVPEGEKDSLPESPPPALSTTTASSPSEKSAEHLTKTLTNQSADQLTSKSSHQPSLSSSADQQASRAGNAPSNEPSNKLKIKPSTPPDNEPSIQLSNEQTNKPSNSLNNQPANQLSSKESERQVPSQTGDCAVEKPSAKEASSKGKQHSKRSVGRSEASPAMAGLCRLVVDETTGQQSYVASCSIAEGAVVMQAVPDVSSPLQLDASLSVCDKLMLSQSETALLQGGLATLAERVGEAVGVLLLVLRCFRLKAEDPARFSKLLALQSNMELQTDDRVAQWTFLAQRLEALLSGDVSSARISWAAMFDPSECLHLLGVAATNAFGTTLNLEMLPVGISISIPGSRFQHSCSPNVWVDHSVVELTFKALRPIAVGEPLNISYCDAYEPTYRRMLKLAETKLFLCTCELCTSRTELESYQGGLHCSVCRDAGQEGWLVPVEPLGRSCARGGQKGHQKSLTSQLETEIQNSRWTCSRSGCPAKELTGVHMLGRDDELRGLLYEAEALADRGGTDAARAALLKLVTKCTADCHPNHYIAYQARTLLATKLMDTLPASNTRDLLLKFELTLSAIAAGLSILHSGYDQTLGALYFELGRSCQSMSQQPPNFEDVLKCLSAVACEHLHRVPFDALRTAHAQRRCLLQSREVAPLIFLCHIGAQAFRFAFIQFKFCFGRDSMKTKAAELCMKGLLNIISQALKGSK